MEIDKCKRCVFEYTELGDKLKPQNLPKADAYSLLADVRAVIQKTKDEALSDDSIHPAVNDTLNRVLRIIDDKISEHFS